VNWLRQLFQDHEPEHRLVELPPPTNLAQHDALLEELGEVALVLRRLNREPITARVRGQYDRRPARPAPRRRKDNTL
jgi:hypothetical protein